MSDLAQSLIHWLCTGVVIATVQHFYEKRRERKTAALKADEKQTLSERVIGDCLDDNLTALDQFIHALAEYLITRKQEEYSEIIQGLASTLSFSRTKPHLNSIILQTILATEQFQGRIQALHEVEELFANHSNMLPNETELLLNIHDAASRLVVTRNALAKALIPYYFPPNRTLRGQFLAGAYLSNSGASWHKVSFASMDFRDALLIGTHFEWSYLSGANFENAVLIYAQMTEANLSGASFRDANLTNAKLTRSDLTDADLTDAKVAWSTLYLAKNVNASWQDADFEAETKRDNKLWRRMKAKFGTTAH